MYALRCPHCGKLLGKSSDPFVSDRLMLWCRLCKAEVQPRAILEKVESQEPGAEQGG